MKKSKVIIATAITIAIAIGGISAIASGNFMKNRKMEHKKPEITAEQKEEMKAKFKERLDIALAEGKITREQYDKSLANIEEGKFGFRFGRGMGMGKGHKPENMPCRKELSEEQKAEMKEKAKERLDSALADGKITREQYDKSLAEIEEGKFGFGFGRGMGMRKGHKPENMPHRKGLSEEQKAEMKEKAKERLDSALADGKITREQYDKSLANIEEGKFGFRFGRGMGMGKGHKPENMPRKPGLKFKNSTEE